MGGDGPRARAEIGRPPPPGEQSRCPARQLLGLDPGDVKGRLDADHLPAEVQATGDPGERLALRPPADPGLEGGGVGGRGQQLVGLLVGGHASGERQSLANALGHPRGEPGARPGSRLLRGRPHAGESLRPRGRRGGGARRCREARARRPGSEELVNPLPPGPDLRAGGSTGHNGGRAGWLRARALRGVAHRVARGAPCRLGALRRHCADGRALRLLTTTYTGSTEQAALELLREAGAEIRVSYDTSTTRLHAKAWLFHPSSGFSTAYIGSSNLTHSAQVTGLEWNVRVSAARNRGVVDKVAAVFESYWESGDFVGYDPDQFARATRFARSDGMPFLSPLEVRLEPFQERLLEQVALAREQGRHRNLLVSATGTGKSVMAAVDYARLARRLPRDRLLFVAHREEILEQARATFRQVLRQASFGERWVAGARPVRFDHVFASVQSLSAAGLAALAPDHFDVVVIDEFHHAAAPTYAAPIDHLGPVELLGLTATPERSDGLDVLGWFEGRIAAELRLWEAIDQHRLSPFHYYGIHDGLDLRDVPWRRGRGYDVAGLTACYTADDLWARRVIAEVGRHVGDVSGMRALGFCVSVEHASFMARVFTEAGLPSVAVSAATPAPERRAVLADLAAGRIRVVFSVDVFNEGVDIPVVDTLLLLRPTDSPTLFLQQLGRGLRKTPGKDVCTVLDFVGLHRREYRLDRRYRASLGGVVATWSARSRVASRSCRRLATSSSTRWRPTSCCRPCVTRCRPTGPPRWTSCGTSRPGTSRPSQDSSRRAGSSSRTST